MVRRLKIMESSDNRRWLNTEVSQTEYKKLKAFLVQNGIKHEASGAYNLVHVEIYCNDSEREMIDKFIDALDESVKRSRMSKIRTESDKGYSSAVYRALDSDFKSEWDDTVDPNYVAEQVDLWLFNTRELYDEIFNNRRPAHSVAYSAMLDLFQDVVDRYDVKVRVTSEMAKQWLKRNGIDYKTLLAPVVSKIEEEREERRNESY